MNRVGTVAVAAILMLLAGCTLHPAPKDSIPFEPIPEFTSTNSVELVNGQPSDEDVKIGGSGFDTIIANRHVWTGTAIDIAARELRKRGLTVVPGAPKQITMSIVDVHFGTGVLALKAEMSMKVTTSSGYSTVYTEKHDSAMENIYRLMSVATTRLVQQMFTDPQIVAFLTH